MMGYTHVAVGAAGAVGMAISGGYTRPETYILAAVFGALGGASPDIDVKNNFNHPTMTDSFRTMVACSGLIALGIALDLILKTGIMTAIISEKNAAVAGLIAFIVLMGIGYHTDHRTFTHSLLFMFLATCCLSLIHVEAATYFIVGCILHVVLDMLNNKYLGHGVRLLYPIKIGKGIALGLCKSDGMTNKALYFIGLGLYAIATVCFVIQLRSIIKSIAPIVIFIYMIVSMHFVREKSERELRCIMHIRGQL